MVPSRTASRNGCRVAAVHRASSTPARVVQCRKVLRPGNASEIASGNAPKMNSDAETAAQTITRGIGRRRFVQAVAALSAGAGVAACTSAPGAGGGASARAGGILQPGGGPVPGDHYLGSQPDQVLWGYVP